MAASTSALSMLATAGSVPDMVFNGMWWQTTTRPSFGTLARTLRMKAIWSGPKWPRYLPKPFGFDGSVPRYSTLSRVKNVAPPYWKALERAPKTRLNVSRECVSSGASRFMSWLPGRLYQGIPTVPTMAL